MKDMYTVLTIHGYMNVTKGWLDHSAPENIVTELSDLTEGKFIILNDAQEAFLKEKDPDEVYSNEQIFNMVHTSKDVIIKHKNEEIKKTRRNAYVRISDPLYIEYQKELALDNIEKAETVKAEWLAKTKEIEEEHPYITE